MNVPQTTELVKPEIAVACRVLQADAFPRELFSWLRNPRKAGPCADDPGLLAMAVEEIVGPIAQDADDWLSSELKHASVWYGFAIENFAALHSSRLDIAKRQLLTVLLPLYRCLATQKLSECFSTSRHRLAEVFAVCAMEETFGPPLSELLATAQRSHECPDDSILANLGLSVSQTAGISMDLCVRLACSVTDLTDETRTWLTEIEPDTFAGQVPAWAEPALLWKLAGEIMSKKPNTLLPRSWVTVPVPWPKITDHWRRIEAEIDRLHEAARSSQTSPPAIAAESIAHSSPSAKTLEALVDKIDHEIEQDAHTDLVTEDTEIATPVEPSEMDGNLPESSYATAEIHNHNDPVFLASLKRRISLARKEQRPFSLATIAVHPDGEAHVKYFDLGVDGIPKWQSKLIDLLSGNPELEDTACYVSGQDELMATIYDVDRSLATAIVRDAILETLAGGGVEAASLADIDIPAKFHVGIATASSPGPNLGPEELVAPSRRCFEAAARQGGASIKSIEVY